MALNKFGVPLGAGGAEGRGGILQPKLKYRFRVITNNFGPTNEQKNLTQQVMTVTKPKLNFEEVQIDSYNSRAWVAGKHTWEMVTLVVRDDITNSVSRLVGHQMMKQLNHFEQTAPAAGINYKFVMDIQTLDGGNDVVQEDWLLEGCWLQNVDYDSLDYAAGAEVQIITMQVRFDNATMAETFVTSPELTSIGGSLIS
jgi:hypothetical protein